MEIADKTENIASVADLKNKWNQLKDVDRAIAVQNIHKAGISFRDLAKALNCSPTLLRQLNLAAQAPLLDHVQARKGKISTRELTRRGKAAEKVRADRDRDALERERDRKSEEVAKAIGDLINRLNWTGNFGERVVEEARFLLANAEAQQQVPPQPPRLRDLPLSQLLERVRPRYKDADVDDIEPCAEWLVKFVLAALPDSMSCHHALNIALDVQSKRK